MDLKAKLDWNKKWVLGNWKMNGSRRSVREFFGVLENLLSREGESREDARREMESRLGELKVSDICSGVACPHIYIDSLRTELEAGRKWRAFQAGGDAGLLAVPLLLGAEDVSHFKDQGAYTGDVSARMAKDVGCDFALVGHSERRTYYHESNEMLLLKLENVLAEGMIPIFCIGENLDERKANEAQKVVASQLEIVARLPTKEIAVAYEPVWAIGTGMTASLEEIGEIHSFIKEEIARLMGPEVKTRVLYGGSVKPNNVKEILSIKDVDGVLVGGASLKAEDFLGLLAGAQAAASAS